jgi:nitroimidazol reductase NimA-like FMN-containing flavoprotein (pyridoxamine 5'-phosphate oxidase superfamily)
MSIEDREAFLAEPHLGVIAIERSGRPPLSVPIWYAYEPGGELWIMIESDSPKERLLRKAQRFSLCVQSVTPPYKFVSVAGPVVSFRASDKERDERLMARRYLGEKMSDAYIALSKADPSNRPGVIVTMRPESWFASDMSQQFVRSADR